MNRLNKMCKGLEWYYNEARIAYYESNYDSICMSVYFHYLRRLAEWRALRNTIRYQRNVQPDRKEME